MKKIIERNLSTFLAQLDAEADAFIGFRQEHHPDGTSVTLTGIHSGQTVTLVMPEGGAVTAHFSRRSGREPATLEGLRKELRFAALTGVKELLLRRGVRDFFPEEVQTTDWTYKVHRLNKQRMHDASFAVGTRTLHVRAVSRTWSCVAFLACVTDSDVTPPEDAFLSIGLMDINHPDWARTAPGRLQKVRAALS